MLDQDIEACPVFVRWQVRCSKCGIKFYVDSEPESTKEDILSFDDMKCEYHHTEDYILMLV